MINFERLNNVEEDTTDTRINLNSNSNSNNNLPENVYNLCFISCCVFTLYFLLTVPTIFMDIILGFMYNNNSYNCTEEKNEIQNITIDKWLITNGISCYLHLTSLILLRRVYTDNTVSRKICKYSLDALTIFIFGWTILGLTIFFSYYYNSSFLFSPGQLCPSFFYDYLFIRMILSPLTAILRFGEMYNV